MRRSTVLSLPLHLVFPADLVKKKVSTNIACRTTKIFLYVGKASIISNLVARSDPPVAISLVPPHAGPLPPTRANQYRPVGLQITLKWVGCIVITVIFRRQALLKAQL